MSCLACGSSERSFWARATDFEYCSTRDYFTYYRCEDCGALSIDPVPDDRLGDIYPPTYYSFDGVKTSFLEQVKQALDRRLFKKVFGQISGSELAALDVGGGTGWLLNQARVVEPRLCSSVVVDIDPKAGVAAEQAGHEYFCGRIEEFETDQKFDLILLLNIIEHVNDPTSVLKKARELLTDGGIILIKTPNYDSLDARIFRSTYWGGLHCPRHWVVFTPESFRLAANSAGLSVSDLTLSATFVDHALACIEQHQQPAIGVTAGFVNNGIDNAAIGRKCCIVREVDSIPDEQGHGVFAVLDQVGVGRHVQIAVGDIRRIATEDKVAVAIS